MIPRGTAVLVAGAEHPQCLSVIRGLGRAGARVIAGGHDLDCPGFHSRYTKDAFQYRSPRDDLSGFVDDVKRAARRAEASLVVPASPASFSALLSARSTLETSVRLAAAPSATLAQALDVTRTFTIGQELGINAPRWCTGPSIPDILATAKELNGPFVVRRRGRDGAFTLPSWSGLSDGAVRIAADREELRRILEPLWDHADCVLVHEAAPGIGRAVAGVWQSGQPIAMVAYEREREWARGGGVSVVRRSIRLDESLARTVTRLFEATEWHGVGTVEFSYDRRAGRYSLLGMSGRFHAAAALSLAAGVNLPAHAVAVHLGAARPERARYRVGVASRWLGGDVSATWDAVVRRAAPYNRYAASRTRTIWQFVRDFMRPMYYDEFARDDALPAIATVVALVVQSVRAVALGCVRLVRAALGDAPAEVRPSGATRSVGYEV